MMAMHGLTFGFKGMATNLGAQFGAGLLLALLGASNPVIVNASRKVRRTNRSCILPPWMKRQLCSWQVA